MAMTWFFIGALKKNQPKTDSTENANIFQNRGKYLPCHFQLGQRRRPGWWRAW